MFRDTKYVPNVFLPFCLFSTEGAPRLPTTYDNHPYPTSSNSIHPSRTIRRIALNEQNKPWIDLSRLSVTTFWPHSGYILAKIWLQSDYTLTTFWLHSNYILTTLWLHSDYILTTFWLYPDYILTIFWLHSDYILTTFWLHSEYILTTFWLFLAKKY